MLPIRQRLCPIRDIERLGGFKMAKKTLKKAKKLSSAKTLRK
jgi:hypothetical protein